MKKVIGIIIVAVAVVVIFGSCGEPPTTKSITPDPEKIIGVDDYTVLDPGNETFYSIYMDGITEEQYQTYLKETRKKFPETLYYYDGWYGGYTDDAKFFIELIFEPTSGIFMVNTEEKQQSEGKKD